MLAVALAATSFVSTAGKFRFGARAGVQVNSVQFKDVKANFSSENRTGFTGGLMAEFTIPIVNLGMDASVMYVHRPKPEESSLADVFEAIKSLPERDYVEVPVNLKLKVALPVLSTVITPYAFTGPSFAFLLNKSALTDLYQHKTVDVSWNAGLGVELLSHLQVGASYSFGIKNALSFVGIKNSPIEGRNNCWTITAAWLF